MKSFIFIKLLAPMLEDSSTKNTMSALPLPHTAKNTSTHTVWIHIDNLGTTLFDHVENVQTSSTWSWWSSCLCTGREGGDSCVFGCSDTWLTLRLLGDYGVSRWHSNGVLGGPAGFMSVCSIGVGGCRDTRGDCSRHIFDCYHRGIRSHWDAQSQNTTD